MQTIEQWLREGIAHQNNKHSEESRRACLESWHRHVLECHPQLVRGRREDGSLRVYTGAIGGALDTLSVLAPDGVVTSETRCTICRPAVSLHREIVNPVGAWGYGDQETVERAVQWFLSHVTDAHPAGDRSVALRCGSTSIGGTFIIRCLLCQQEYDATDYDSW